MVFDHDCSVKEVLELDSALHLVTKDDTDPFRRSSVTDLTVAGSAGSIGSVGSATPTGR